MKTTPEILLAVFAAAMVFHLIAIACGWKRARQVSKLCIVPPLIGCYCLRAEPPLFTVILGAALGWAGDFFLLKITRQRNFILGLGSFLGGHLCYIASMLMLIEGFNRPVLIACVAVAIPLTIEGMKVIHPAGIMRIPSVVYAFALQGMAFCALQLMLSRPGPAGIVVFAGSLCFLVSDTLLGCLTFKTPPTPTPEKTIRLGEILVMLTYSVAQGCIIAGLAYRFA